MDINIIEDASGKGKDFSKIKQEDVVILPAFGASVQEMQLLNDRGVQIVDTTCPWVAKVGPCPRNHGAHLFLHPATRPCSADPPGCKHIYQGLRSWPLVSCPCIPLLQSGNAGVSWVRCSKPLFLAGQSMNAG